MTCGPSWQRDGEGGSDNGVRLDGNRAAVGTCNLSADEQAQSKSARAVPPAVATGQRFEELVQQVCIDAAQIMDLDANLIRVAAVQRDRHDARWLAVLSSVGDQIREQLRQAIAVPHP